MRDGVGIRVQGDFHPDPLCQAISELICNGELIQAIGRGRGIWRTEMTPLDIDLLFNTVLPITVDAVVPWKDVSSLIETAIELTDGQVNGAIIQQIIAGLRWIWLNYGSPGTAWEFIQRTGRFDSYPRRGTNNAPVRSPLALCPVDGRVFYQDDFGEVRTVGGYHPHWGNDVVAPTGRAIRAPFDGLAVAHSDNWFAGNWVTVTGERGYVRNGHMSAFARLGFVKAGTVIGYVGSTGDARGPHDHFEWHPWAAPAHPHRAPSGFTRIMDAIDPNPYLNAVCGTVRTAPARRAPSSE